MAKAFSSGIYHPRNTSKYVGKKPPVYRSSWERYFMQFLDANINILWWSSEPTRIPYRNPITDKATHYIPDFLIAYRDRDGNEKIELVEIKPRNQVMGFASNPNLQLLAVINEAKWEQAKEWCRQNDVVFRVLTENELFHHPKGVNK